MKSIFVFNVSLPLNFYYSQQKQAYIYFTILGLVFLMLIAFLLVKQNRTKQKAFEIVSKQNEEITHQKNIIEEHQKDIIDSITYAKRLQLAILPSDEEIKKHLPDSFILYKPKDIVAGDFYWMHHTPSLSGRPGEFFLFIAAADSTGHGVPGAMVSVVCCNALNRAVDEFKLRETGKILDKARELVLETFAKSGEEIKDGMDISLLRIESPSSFSNVDGEKARLQWSGANNPLWYIQNNVLNELKPDKQSIGKSENSKPFTTHQISLSHEEESRGASVFYLMTDGFADQFGGEKGKKYKYKQLQEKLIAINNHSCARQKENLVSSFDEWKGNLEQVDDVTIIGIRI